MYRRSSQKSMRDQGYNNNGIDILASLKIKTSHFRLLKNYYSHRKDLDKVH